MCVASIFNCEFMKVELDLHLPQQIIIRLVKSDPNDGPFPAAPLADVLNRDVGNPLAMFVYRGGNHACPTSRLDTIIHPAGCGWGIPVGLKYHRGTIRRKRWARIIPQHNHAK